MQSNYDVIVVGARCAGAATAMLLARSGLRVLAVDPRRPGTDTLSTHALMRGGVLQLHRWGLIDELERANTPVVRTTTFRYGDDVIPVAIKPKDGIEGLYAPRRTVLDSILVEAAVDSGAEVVFGARMLNLLHDTQGRVRGAVIQGPDGSRSTVFADRVVGADGVRSPVAKLVGARTYRQGTNKSGNVYAYWSGLDLDGYQWYWREGVSAGAIQTNDGNHCVFASMPGGRFDEEIRQDLEAGYHRVIAECSPELAEQLRKADRVEKLRGFGGVPGHLREAWGPGWALVGDAGYFKDPITAHGISDALRDAEILTRAILYGVDYQATRDALSVDLFEVTDEVASYTWTLEEVQEIHMRLSKAMNHEVEWIRSLDEARAEVA